MEKTYIIEGMSCQNCKRHVENAITEVAGVKHLTVSLEEKTARVEGDFSDEAIIAAVASAGYRVEQ